MASMTDLAKWQSQAAALRCLAALARKAQTQVSHCTLDCVPRLSGARVRAEGGG